MLMVKRLLICWESLLENPLERCVWWWRCSRFRLSSSVLDSTDQK